jgi:hypothetical protein
MGAPKGCIDSNFFVPYLSVKKFSGVLNPFCVKSYYYFLLNIPGCRAPEGT